MRKALRGGGDQEVRIKTVSKAAFVLPFIGLLLFALGGTAFASTGQNGPYPVPSVGDPVAGSNEKAVVKFVATGGTFTLSFNGATTAAIVYNPEPSVVQSALTALATIGSGNAYVVGYPGTGIEIRLTGALGSSDQPDMTADFSGLTGVTTPGTIVVTNGGTVTGQQSPHGGFSAATDFCQQCHSVHNAPSDYALLWQNTVTATCNTCHAINGGGGLSPVDSNNLIGDPTVNGAKLLMGTTSMRSSYDVASPPVSHTIGKALSPDNIQMMTSGWAYGAFSATTWSGRRTADGLQCTSCHEPHGDFGQLINSPTGVVRTFANELDVNPTGTGSLTDKQTFAEGTLFYFNNAIRQLHRDVDATTGTPDTVAWESCIKGTVTAVADAVDTVGATACQYLTTTDSEGQTVSLYGYKLLTAYPNHDYTGSVLGGGGGESWGLDSRTHDMARWCGTCHPKEVPSEYSGGTFHNHPTGCTACHGNPSDGSSSDFPHTSTFSKFLKSYPDGLCVSCHTAGRLP
jgi:predicted CXXCH cytochrome family protein